MCSDTTFDTVRRGYTLVEVLIVIALLLVVSVITILGFQNYARYQQYNQAVSEIRLLVTDTQSRARNAERDNSYGIKISPQSIIVFPGATYNVSNSQNQTFNFPNVTLTPTFSNNDSELVFSKLTGLPNATGTIVISGVSFTDSRTVTIRSTGVVE